MTRNQPFSPIERALGDRNVYIPRIWSGMVRDVDPKTHTYTVLIDGGGEEPDIPLISPYFSNQRGQGYTAVAAKYTRCVGGVTESNEYFIMGFMAPVGIKTPATKAKRGVTGDEKLASEQQQASSYEGRSGNRSTDLQIDDQEIRGPLGNAIRVRASGALEIISQDGQLLTRYINIPGEHSVITVAELIETILPSGTFVWKADIENGTGYSKWEIKSVLGDDQEADIIFKAGTLPDDDSDAGQKLVVIVQSDARNIRIAVSPAGEVKIECEDLTIEAAGKVQVDCKTAEVRAKSQVKISGSRIDLN